MDVFRGKVNKKVIAIMVVGVCVVALVTSTFAFGLLKKEKVESTVKQEVSKVQEEKKSTEAQIEKEELTPEKVKALKDYQEAIRALKKAEEKYGNLVLAEPRKFQYLQKNKKFCKQLYSDFKDHQNVKIISPFIRTDDFNDERIKSYFGKCSKKYKNWSNKIFDNYTLKENGEYSYDFRLYDIAMEIPNNKISDVYLFYEGGGILFKENIQVYDLFILLNVNNCKILHQKSSPPMIDYFTKEKTGNINGVFSYCGDYYLYTFYSNDGLSFYKYIAKDSSQFPVTPESVCDFHRKYEEKGVK